jgi:pimeloyl-ACP methyl ester carboxylesterase
MDQFTNDGLQFDVTEDGPPDGPVVVLLHGFPADRRSWEAVVPPLVAAGYRTLAPDLRGYSPGARPRRRRDYALDRLEGDVLALADQAGVDRFHLVGHDWGAALAWFVAARHPGRVRSLTALSVPHPGAFEWSTRHSSQLLHSWYMGFFQLPAIPELVLSAGGGSHLRRALERSGLEPGAAARYAARATEPGALHGPIGWYRGIPFTRANRIGAVDVPTLFVWSDGDRFVRRAGALRCARFVTGPYRYMTLEGLSHWLPEAAPQRVAELILVRMGGPASPA